MRFKDLFSLSSEEIFWSLKFGLPRKKGVIYDLRQDGFREIDRPVFFLSTGRCGTNWFALLLKSDRRLRVFHEPQPNLGIQGKAVYETYKKNEFAPPENERRLIREMFLAGREQYLRYSFKAQRRFVETNNHITFFAPAINDLLPSALFVHLYRHPGEFVRSAVRRNFYAMDNKENLKRIVPLKQSVDGSAWPGYDQVRKNAWLWNETNRYIENFKAGIPAEKVFSFNFNDLTEENVSKLMEFMGAWVSPSRIGKALGRRSNIQKEGSFKSYIDWDEPEKDKLVQICGELATKYGYKL
jgi:hypothetical protein